MLECWKCGKLLWAEDAEIPAGRPDFPGSEAEPQGEIELNYCPFCGAKQEGKWCPTCGEWREALWTLRWSARRDYEKGVDYKSTEKTVPGEVKFCAKCGSELVVKGPPHE